jgi:hypothetical protein
MKKILGFLKSVMVVVVEARRDAAVQKAKSGLYHWE